MPEPAIEFLVRRGIHRALGARPMRRTVQKFIGDAIRDALKSNASPSGLLAVSSDNDHLTISPSVEGHIFHFTHAASPDRSNFR
jgi:ATP-dependent Clp protease ATP-binding subunit ClpA